MSSVELLVERDWPSVAGNPKSAVAGRRLEKTRRRLATWRRKVDMLERLVRRHVGPDARVLEVACGTGLTVLELASRGFSCTGLDADPNLCALTTAAGQHFGLRADAVAGDACALPFGDGTFDVVYSESFFEHVYDVETALREQTRVLRPGGVLVIIDGNLLNPVTLVDLLFLYPVRTRGRHGGVRWLLTKRRVHRNLYGYLPLGRDEDVKTVWWWRRRLRGRSDLRLLEAGTSARDLHPGIPAVLAPFVGACRIVAERV